MDVVGDRWSILLLREAYYGTKRFDEFQYYLGVAPNILSTRLKKFVDLGMMTRIPLPEHSGRYEYVLTKKGRDFFRLTWHLRSGGMTGLRSPKGRRSFSRIARPGGKSNTHQPPCQRAASLCNSKTSKLCRALAPSPSTESDSAVNPWLNERLQVEFCADL